MYSLLQLAISTESLYSPTNDDLRYTSIQFLADGGIGILQPALFYGLQIPTAGLHRKTILMRCHHLTT